MVLTDATTGRTVADAIKVVPVEIETQMVSADAIKLVANDAEDVLYVQTDQLGAAQKMTDDGRAVVWDAAFTPFGEIDSILGSATNNQRFPGQYADTESDLSCNYFRDYDPTLGRYIQSDPIGLAGGLNTFGYVGGNPVNAVDPTGEVIETPLDVAFIAYDLFRIASDNDVVAGFLELQAPLDDLAVIARHLDGAFITQEIGRV